MCGCMQMQEMINQDGYQHPVQSQPVPLTNEFPSGSGQKCVNCGFSLRTEFKFCPSCGKSLQTAKCPSCEQIVDPTWSACAYCGSPLG